MPLFVFAFFLMAANCFAEPAPPLLDSEPAPPSQNITVGKPSAVPALSKDKMYLSAGPGLTFFKNDFARDVGLSGTALSTNVSLLRSFNGNRSFRVGADIGLDLWNSTSQAGVLAQRGIGVRFLPTAIYAFNTVLFSHFSPYIGVAAGPYLYSGRVQRSGSSTNLNAETSVVISLLFRPGIEWDIVPDFTLNLEPRIGFIGRTFAFLPVITANLSL